MGIDHTVSEWPRLAKTEYVQVTFFGIFNHIIAPYENKRN